MISHRDLSRREVRRTLALVERARRKFDWLAQLHVEAFHWAQQAASWRCALKRAVSGPPPVNPYIYAYIAPQERLEMARRARWALKNARLCRLLARGEGRL